MKNFFNFYINSSIHVSLAVLSLTAMTYNLFNLPVDNKIMLFTFFSSVVGYNSVKYGRLLVKKGVSQGLKVIRVLSIIAAIAAFGLFFTFGFSAQILILLTGVLTLLYGFSLFGGKNLRNLKGIKIYIVALCWVLATLLLPLFQTDFQINTDVWIKSIQRFLLIIILILIFEIIDLKEDDPNLRTMPQTIGIRKTKILGIILLFVFFGLEFLLSDYRNSQLFINGVLALVTVLFTLFATQNRSKYYTTFWVESIPVLWFLLTVLFR